MKKIIAIILIVVGLGLAYMGYDTVSNSRASIEIGDLEISAGDQSQKQTGYVYFGLAAVALIGGGVVLAKK
jgi:hypothetical protein